MPPPIPMITGGTDLASQPSRTATCIIEWRSQVAAVEEIFPSLNDGELRHHVGSVDKLGIDIPLGWPIAFVKALEQHSKDGSWPASYNHEGNRDYRLRRTDRWVHETLGFPSPLSVSTNFISIPAMRAAAVLSRLPDRVALDGTGVVVEAYPAAALRR